MPVVTNSTSVAVAAEHAQRAVAGAGQRGRRLDDAGQHAGEVEVAGDRGHGLEQGAARRRRGRGSGWGSPAQCGPVSRRRSGETAYGQVLPRVPAAAELAPGDLGPRDAYDEVALARRPRARLPGPGDLGELLVVVDEGRPTAHHDAPAALELVVELVDLEAQLGVAAVGPEQAVRPWCGPGSSSPSTA